MILPSEPPEGYPILSAQTFGRIRRFENIGMFTLILVYLTVMKPTIHKFLLASGLLFVLLQAWGAFHPSYSTWGMNMLGWYDTAVAAIIAVVAVLLFLPKVQQSFLRKAESLAGVFAKRPAWLSFAAVSSILIILGLLLPARLHLLGDGALLVRVISGLGLNGETPPAFNHQPLVAMIFTGLKKIMGAMESISSETLFRIVDSIVGLLFVALVFLFIRKLPVKTFEKMLLGSFLFFTAGTQFFLGYVELYVFLYTATAAYVITGWLALERKISVVIPVVCLGLMIGLHFSVLILSPSLLVLLYNEWKIRKSKIVLVLSVGAVIALAAYGVTHFDPQILEKRLTMELQYNFLPLFSTGGYFPYTVFSFNHIIDWVNANVLIAPFGLAITAICLIGSRKKISWSSPAVIFLSSAAFFGLLFTLTVNTALGMARDWDFLASFFVPLIVLDMYLLQAHIQEKQFRQVLLVIIALAGMQTFAWIGINSNEDRHLARYMRLNDPAFMGSISQLNYHETLGAMYYARNDMQHASIFFDHYLEIDSSNTRILANISQVYKRLGNEEKEFHWLKRSALLNSPNPTVYMNLGVLYAHRKDTASAIAYNERAIQVDSTFSKAHANLGILNMLQNNYPKAAEHYSKAIEYGLREHFLYRDAASSYFFLRRYDEALKYYDEYLTLEPGDTKTKSVRDQLRAWVAKP